MRPAMLFDWDLWPARLDWDFQQMESAKRLAKATRALTAIVRAVGLSAEQAIAAFDLRK